MRFIEIFIRRPVLSTMLTCFLVVLGLFSYRDLGVDLMPDVELPVVTVTTTLRGASPEEIETSVTRPIEEIINTINGIDELRSTSSEGRSVVVVNFKLERDRDSATQDVRDKVSSILNRLPEGTDPPVVTRFDLDAAPAVTLVISGPLPIRDITEIARRRVKELLETLPGVGAVELVGGELRAVNVYLDGDRMEALGVTVEDVRRALASENQELPGGRVAMGSREQFLRIMGRLENTQDFLKILVLNRPGAPVRLGDVARIEDSIEERTSLARYNGDPAVTLVVRKQSGSNTVEVVKAVKERAARLLPTLPAGLRVDFVRDQSVFIDRSVHEVQFHLILGAVLTALSVLLFMRSLRATLVAAVAIPASLIATFTIMRALGFTLNNMTLLAMTLAVGIVIDDAIVVMENIFRHIEELGKKPLQAAIDGTKEISLAVTATTFSLVVIFLPVAFMEGRVGRFFFSYGVTVAVAILLSLLISFTLTPMMSARILRHGKGIDSKGGLVYQLIDRGYGWMLRWSLRHRWLIVFISLAIAATSVPLYNTIGKDFLPQDDRSEFEVVVQAPEGTSLEGTEKVLAEIEQGLAKLPGVQGLLTTIGESGSSGSDVTLATIYVKLIDLEERDFPQRQVMNQARALLKTYKLRTAVQAIGNVGGGRGFSGELNFTLRGPEPQALEQSAERILVEMNQMPGLVDVDSSLSVRRPELRVEVDRTRAADLGVKVGTIASSLRTLVGGEQVTRYRDGDEQFDVWLRLEEGFRDGAEPLYRLKVPSAAGDLIPLANLVRLDEARGPAGIDRVDRQRQVTVSANLEGLDLGQAMQQLQGKVAKMDLPPTVEPRFTGRGRIFLETYINLATAFGLSLIFMYMILAAQFESLLHPVTILLALPLAMPFALLSLIMLGETLNIYSIFGLFMLAGVIKKNGILQIDHTLHLRGEGLPREQAIIQANHARLRPILMTTLTLIAGMIPIALGQGPGAANRASMAKVIIGGQGLSLLITLLITPVAYSLFDDATLKLRRWFGRSKPAAEEASASDSAASA